MKTYEDAVKLLTSPKTFKIDLGLERIEKILELLGNPQDRLKCIHVAGTNGKGSVCAIIATILSKAGIKTGLYTSPHIFDYTERIRILEGKKSRGQEGKLLTIESGKWKVERFTSCAPSPDGEGWDGVISIENSEIPQEQLTDKNHSTLRPFNHSTLKSFNRNGLIALSPYRPIAFKYFTFRFLRICFWNLRYRRQKRD